MENKIYLKTNIKFRKEKKFVLLCDCLNFIDFQLPLEYFNLLKKLSKGLVFNSNLKNEEIEVLKDLNTMELLADTPDCVSENNNNLNNIKYDEKEFY